MECVASGDHHGICKHLSTVKSYLLKLELRLKVRGAIFTGVWVGIEASGPTCAVFSHEDSHSGHVPAVWAYSCVPEFLCSRVFDAASSALLSQELIVFTKLVCFFLAKRDLVRRHVHPGVLATAVRRDRPPGGGRSPNFASVKGFACRAIMADSLFDRLLVSL